MRVYFSTVLRSAPPHHGGELVLLDWEKKEILARRPIVPSDPDIEDPNPRGNTRGGRGIEILGDEVLCCSYHSLLFFDRNLVPRRRFTHPLFVSLHETVPAGDGTLWVTSTAIDAAFRVDLQTGEVVEERHPRAMPGIAAALGLTPLELPTGRDPRSSFLGREHFEHPHHVHLNAVALVEGRLFALLSKPGVIADLDRDRIVARHKSLKGSHNLRLGPDGLLRVSYTLERCVLLFDPHTGRRVRKIRFGRDGGLRRRLRRHDLVYRARRALARVGLVDSHPNRPGFVRGLAIRDGRLFVGISPATIVEIDERTGRVVDRFDYAEEVRACVHGLEVEP